MFFMPSLLGADSGLKNTVPRPLLDQGIEMLDTIFRGLLNLIFTLN